MAATSEKFVLDVPYRDKDEAKELGAWWDPEIKKWYVPAGKDRTPFREWFPKEEGETDTHTTQRAG